MTEDLVLSGMELIGNDDLIYHKLRIYLMLRLRGDHVGYVL